jgi:hypothetical protein
MKEEEIKKFVKDRYSKIAKQRRVALFMVAHQEQI